VGGFLFHGMSFGLDFSNQLAHEHPLDGGVSMFHSISYSRQEAISKIGIGFHDPAYRFRMAMFGSFDQEGAQVSTSHFFCRE
jgi:hypothetical protein